MADLYQMTSRVTEQTEDGSGAVVTFKCVSCGDMLTKFKISVRSAKNVTLVSSCGVCKVIYEFDLTIDDLVALGEGREVALVGGSKFAVM